MLDELRSLFRQTWGAFRAELGRRDPADEVADLLAAMRREMVAARAALPEYAAAVRDAEAALAAEQRTLASTERRRALATKIGDDETARIADDFAARHRERVAVLEQKLDAARAEQALREREAAEMMRQYKAADANRFALLGELRNRRARDRIDGALGSFDDPLADFGRMEESIHDRAAYADAVEEMSGLDDAGSAAAEQAAAREQSVEERLRELKRRMGHE
jgi:phage shock protein A